MADAESSADTDPSGAFDLLNRTVTAAWKEVDARVIVQQTLLLDMDDTGTTLGRFMTAAKRLPNVTKNIPEANRLALEGSQAGDEQQKQAMRAALQQSLFDCAANLYTANDCVLAMAKEWRAMPDVGNPAAAPPAIGRADALAAVPSVEKQSDASKPDQPPFPPQGEFNVTYSPGTKHTVVKIEGMAVSRRGDHGEFQKYDFHREKDGSLSLSHSAGFEIWRIGPGGNIIIDRWKTEADSSKPPSWQGELETIDLQQPKPDAPNPAATPSPDERLDGKKQPEILERLAGTKWVNQNKATFEWTADGRFLHNGVERKCDAIGALSVEIVFNVGNIGTLTFDEKLTQFKQYGGNRTLLFTGRRQK